MLTDHWSVTNNMATQNSPRTLSPDDRREIEALAVRYANTIDERNWPRFRTVFTDDCYYELVNFGRLSAKIEGLDALTDFMAGSIGHPLAHHVTNVEILTEHEPVHMLSKVFAPNVNGVYGSCDYHDEIVRTSDGWRIKERRVTLRRRTDPPPQSPTVTDSTSSSS